VTVVGIGLLLGAGARALILLRSSRRRVEMAELGTVSEQWLAEQVRESKTLSRLVDAFERAEHPVQSSTDMGAATT
jgi:lysylphosphatidylglycerol synthetase-like protein (DUF2156 family)